MRLAVVLACLVAPAASLGHAGAGQFRGKSRGSHFVEPLKFDQKLLICNAYPSKAPVHVAKNGQTLEFSGSRGLKFDECAYAPTGVLSKDKIDFEVTELGIQGTFEVSDLPESDAVLLLVVQKRDPKSKLVSFQSFAFPSNNGDGEAHLAVIDASVGVGDARLKVRDLPRDPKAASKERPEELSFNRMYSLDPGAYHLSMDDSNTEVEFAGHKDYVVLRTSSGKTSQLLAFPHEEPVRGSAAPLGGALAGALAALVVGALA